MGNTGKKDKARIKQQRKTLGIDSSHIPANGNDAKRLIEKYDRQIKEKLDATPDLSGSRQVQARRSETSGNACAIAKCKNVVGSRQTYCKSCKDKVRSGKIKGVIKRTYADKPCAWCGDMFAPTGTTHKWCSDVCKTSYKGAGNLSKNQVELGAKAKTAIDKRICGLVGCDNVTPLSSGKKRQRRKKYCCETHSVKANKAYTAFKCGRITLDQLKGIVKEVYFRGKHKELMELEQVTPQLPVVKLTANEAYARAMQVCEQIAAQEFEKILEMIDAAIMVPAFELRATVEQSKMTCSVIEKMLVDAEYTVIMDHDRQRCVGTYDIGWDMSEPDIVDTIELAQTSAEDVTGLPSTLPMDIS